MVDIDTLNSQKNSLVSAKSSFKTSVGKFIQKYDEIREKAAKIETSVGSTFDTVFSTAMCKKMQDLTTEVDTMVANIKTVADTVHTNIKNEIDRIQEEINNPGGTS